MLPPGTRRRRRPLAIYLALLLTSHLGNNNLGHLVIVDLAYLTEKAKIDSILSLILKAVALDIRITNHGWKICY